MKKFLVVVTVLAIACLSSVALAADVTVNGEVAIRSRDLSYLDAANPLNKKLGTTQAYTQERTLLEVNVKADGAKGKIAIWNDWDNWGRIEAPQGNGNNKETVNPNGSMTIREAWVDFKVPGLPLPIFVKAGHQLLKLGNGWYFQSMYDGSDAWVVYLPLDEKGTGHIAFINIKAYEGTTGQADDIDAYTLLGVFKLGDDMTVGADLSNTDVRRTLSATVIRMNYYNIGLNFNGKIGPANLHAQADIQTGKIYASDLGAQDLTMEGNQIVVQADMPVDPLTLHATLARGSGDKSATDDKYGTMRTSLDRIQRYTLIYEYLLTTAAGATHTGFANTTAVGVGAMYQAAKSIAIGADVWYLQATEKVALNGNPETSSDLGTEVDLTANWQLAPTLSWNWQYGYFAPGKAYQYADGTKDSAQAIQGILSLKF